TRDAAWVTLHTFEPRALALLGVDRVPVQTFGSAAGLDGYVGAVQRAAAELGLLYGRPVRFVHPLPLAAVGPTATRAELMRRIAGGAGYDLDSLVTLLPARAGKAGALVADLRAGGALLQGTPAADWARFRATYSIAGQVSPATLVAATAGDAGGRLAS